MEGFIYPNEFEVGWSLLIVIYAYISGIVAGSFFVASLYKLFKVDTLKPVFRLSILTSLAFLISTNIPLVSHLGHPERGFEILITPHFSSAMAVFGYDALYLLSILTLIILYDYRKDLVNLAKEKGAKSTIYRILTLGDYDISEKAVKADNRVVYYITWIAFPSIIFLHGYLGFIFGSIKANHWWNTSLMPVIFLLSGIVSGIAIIMLIYVIISKIRRENINLACVETLAGQLLLFLIIDISLELLELVHILYLQEEGIEVILGLITDKLFVSYIIVQIGLGGLLPIAMLGAGKISKSAGVKKTAYTLSSLLVLIGVFAMRWNVIIGGQLISKSLRGFTSYHIPVFGQEGLFVSIAALSFPFVVLWVLTRIFPTSSNTGQT